MTHFRASTSLVSLIVLLVAFVPLVSRGADLPPERLLWADGEPERQITYEEKEGVRSPPPPAGSPSGSNRVFSYVSKPTYSIHRAPESVANGVGLVICPGGAYVDVWLDREGHDLAIWLKDRGVTSLVLKYRTNAGNGDKRKYTWGDYLPAVEADARQAIRVLRRQAPSLDVDPARIGICGFSAGGHLALSVSLFPEREGGAKDVSGAPDFAGLFYPWLRDDYASHIEKSAASIPPLFIMNSREDRATPAPRCVEFYSQLLEAGVRCELHVFEKGGHGFDLGDGRGASTALWKTSFVAWLEDAGFTGGE